ncbi:hypothetical protein PVK06_016822 [Gossypium arboreum]|uniref:Uncharacterized protein n=1 Tax=Gossypium arboreum TaxID=29729 RepID=A0ABR0Q1V3_GOSAR|nr:hypothetical protein PVK06_016822 [Gossypium arboreum]
MRHSGIPAELEDILQALDQEIENKERRNDFLSTCEPFLISELATSLDYIGWFKLNDKPYLLLASERSQQHRSQGDPQWVARTRSASTTEEEDEVSDQPRRPYQREAEVNKQSPNQIVQQNHRRARRPPSCGTHLSHP